MHSRERNLHSENATSLSHNDREETEPAAVASAANNKLGAATQCCHLCLKRRITPVRQREEESSRAFEQQPRLEIGVFSCNLRGKEVSNVDQPHGLA